ncbi:hypothetical protein ACWZJV_05470 [Nocardioides sp. WG-D5]
MSITNEKNQRQTGGRVTARSLLYGPIDHNERRAWRRIDKVTKRAHKKAKRIDEATARLIAATVHGGPGSALERFAATGHLINPKARTELEAVRFGTPPTRWLLALATFLEATDASKESNHGTA